MEKKKLKSPSLLREVAPKTRFGLSVPPPLRMPHEDLIPGSIPPEGIPDKSIPSKGRPLKGIPPTGLPDEGIPDNGIPDTGTPQTGIPPEGIPLEGRPDSGIPSSGIPLQGIPQRGMADPGIPSPGIPRRGPAKREGKPSAHAVDLSKGFVGVPNDLLDNPALLPSLDPIDQVVLLRLYRLSRGYWKDTCAVGLMTLAEACHIARSRAQKAVATLIERGFIARDGLDIGSSGQSTSVYKVLLPGIPRKGMPDSGIPQEDRRGPTGGTLPHEGIPRGGGNKNTDLIQKQRTHTRVSGSQYSLQQRQDYVEFLGYSGAEIRNPGGLAVALADGSADRYIGDYFERAEKGARSGVTEPAMPAASDAELLGNVQEALRGEIPDHEYDTWFLPLSGACIFEEALYLEAPNRIFVGWVGEQYGELLQSLAEGFGVERVEVVSREGN
ncbi:MAG TPA: DnaA N-terminal domain-containing protein [Blastocatellia bacterium]